MDHTLPTLTDHTGQEGCPSPSKAHGKGQVAIIDERNVAGGVYTAVGGRREGAVSRGTSTES